MLLADTSKQRPLASGRETISAWAKFVAESDADLSRHDQQPDANGRRPIALVGKVWCKAVANDPRIRVGDLLTTSTVPGHAMKANDPSRAFGAVIGKALRRLSDGQGLIPILVALQ